MSFEIKSKYNDFLNTIDKIDNTDVVVINNCICNTSSDNISSNTNDNISKTNLTTNIKINEKNNDNNSNESLSLLNTDSEHEKIWIDNNKNNDSSVDSEFNEIFKNKITKSYDSKEEQTKKLDKLFDKKIIKKINKKKINENKIYDKNMTNDELLKKISEEVENNIFLEATCGYNLKNNMYKLSLDKLKKNLDKFILLNNYTYEIGYIYRDFENPKVYSTNEENTYWKSLVKNKSNKINNTELEPSNKFLCACLKNFINSSKFKKKIGTNMFRTFKKTVQLNNNNALIIDIIFFVKCNL